MADTIYKIHFLLYRVILLGLLTSGLRDVEISVPAYIRHGEDIVFRCNYNLEMDNLYAVKWYKEAEEFYRYVLKEVPPQQVFSLTRGGVDVDIRFSNDHDVLLRNVSLEQSGLFKCTVSAESTFQTVEKAKHVTIVGIGYDSPRVHLDQALYRPGDTVKANCTLEKTYPLPNLTWFINDRQVKNVENTPNWVTVPWTRPIHTGSIPTVGTVVSEINFTLPESFFPTTIVCRIQMFDLYDESTLKRIQPIPRKYSLKSGSGSGTLNTSTVELKFNGQATISISGIVPVKGELILTIAIACVYQIL